MVSFCFIISMVICVGLVAQNNDIKINELTDTPLSPKAESVNVQKWHNLFEQFIGVWSLEKTVVNDEGKEEKVHPGTFMVVHPNASYTIFAHCDIGAVITSQGNIIIESSDQYVEVISSHVNASLVGISNRIDYKLSPIRLYKSFWIEKDKKGNSYAQWQ